MILQRLVIPLLLTGIVVFSTCTDKVLAEGDGLSIKEMLLTPGDLTKAHAELESKCEACHVHFDKSSQTKLCLECHENIATDLQLANGFHGKTTTVANQECRFCHTDHKGRNEDITQLNEQTFNHELTNFELTGTHESLKCDQCHGRATPPKSVTGFLKQQLPHGEGYRFESLECQSCHLDIHETKLGDKCQDCHDTTTWSPKAFDHSKTLFPLQGSHESLVCDSCHRNKTMVGLNVECKSCHLAEDAHIGVFGQKCEVCHSEKQWSPQSYDHLKETGFALRYKHKESNNQSLGCISCHAEEKNPQTECEACHQKDDIHQGSNGNDCKACHDERGWQEVSFEHNLKTTGFLLEGKHQQLACESCHLPGKRISDSITNNTVKTCLDCHQSTNPHGKIMADSCGSCHQTDGWNLGVKFSHDFSLFPLTGSHQLLSCDSCHQNLEYKETAQECSDCHLQDDVHKSTLGRECATCHDTTTWSHWQFNHDKQTKFILNGAHQNLQCKLCHNSTWNKPKQPPKDCYSCHRQDDVHNGSFGSNCAECHSESSFSDYR